MEPLSDKHLLSAFDLALSQLRNDVLTMASLTEASLLRSRQGLFDRNDEACNTVIADDEAIDQLEKQVDKDGVALLTRFQPVAGDLRHVVSAMKVSSNLERIADQAVNISRKGRKLNQAPLLSEIKWIQPMFQQALALFSDSLKAYVDNDVELAILLKPRDKRLDALNGEIATLLTDIMAKNPSRIPDFLNLMFICRHLERVGDHATNIAEDAVYAAAGRDVRHVHTRAANQ